MNIKSYFVSLEKKLKMSSAANIWWFVSAEINHQMFAADDAFKFCDILLGVFFSKKFVMTFPQSRDKNCCKILGGAKIYLACIYC